MSRLGPDDVACWLLKTNRPPDVLERGWAPGEERELTRCVRPSYRLGLMAPGRPCLLWLSGPVDPGVHAVGVLAGPPAESADGPVVRVRLTRLAEPLPRSELLARPDARTAEVLRMPAGSNPSWLSPAEHAAVLQLLGRRHGWEDGSP